MHEFEENPKTVGVEPPDRRQFIGALSALGLGAMSGLLGSTQAKADVDSSHNGGTPHPPSLSSVESVKVSREEVFDVPGGKEYFYEFQARDRQGATIAFKVHASKVETADNYTTTTDVVVDRLGHGKLKTVSTQQRSTVFGVKGDIVGNVRNDKLVITTVFADGTTSREEIIAPVRLDLAHLASQPLDKTLLKAGRHRIAQRG